MRAALAALLVGAIALGLAGCIGDPPPTDMGDVSITASFPADAGQECAPTSTGTIQFQVTPTQLSGGGNGSTTPDRDTVQLPQFAQEAGQDANGAPVHRCEASKTFFSLRPGSWRVEVAWSTGSRTCGVLVRAGQESQLTAGDGPCEVDDGTDLKVLIANPRNTDDWGGLRWRARIDRLATQIVERTLLPDVISLTESTGWWTGSNSAGDYEMAERLIARLHETTGVQFRVAYMVGTLGGVGATTTRYHSGDTLLYNPARIRNLNPTDLAGRPQVGHDSQLEGTVVRRSLPLCNRVNPVEPLEDLIDGVPQTDKCSRPTPSGPAWALVFKRRDGSLFVAASLARLQLTSVNGSTFDLFTTHPDSGNEGREDQAAPINEFIRSLTSDPVRTVEPTYPLLVMGDFNFLEGPDAGWPAGTRQVWNDPVGDVMVIAMGGDPGPGKAPQRGLNPIFTTSLPSLLPVEAMCSGRAEVFSDHCALLAAFETTG